MLFHLVQCASSDRRCACLQCLPTQSTWYTKTRNRAAGIIHLQPIYDMSRSLKGKEKPEHIDCSISIHSEDSCNRELMGTELHSDKTVIRNSSTTTTTTQEPVPKSMNRQYHLLLGSTCYRRIRSLMSRKIEHRGGQKSINGIQVSIRTRVLCSVHPLLLQTQLLSSKCRGNVKRTIV